MINQTSSVYISVSVAMWLVMHGWVAQWAQKHMLAIVTLHISALWLHVMWNAYLSRCRLAIFAICTDCSPLLTAWLCHYTCTKEAVPMHMYAQQYTIPSKARVYSNCNHRLYQLQWLHGCIMNCQARKERMHVCACVCVCVHACVCECVRVCVCCGKKWAGKTGILVLYQPAHNVIHIMALLIKWSSQLIRL